MEDGANLVTGVFVLYPVVEVPMEEPGLVTAQPLNMVGKNAPQMDPVPLSQKPAIQIHVPVCKNFFLQPVLL